MPEIDTKARPWHEMMGKFNEYANEFKAEKTLFGQQLFISSQEIQGVDASKKKGVCHGLAVLYLEYMYAGNKEGFLKDMFRLCAALADTSRPPLKSIELPGLSLNDGLAEGKRRGIPDLERKLAAKEREINRKDAEVKRNPNHNAARSEIGALLEQRRVISQGLTEAREGFVNPDQFVLGKRDKSLADRFEGLNTLRSEIFVAHESQHSPGIINPQIHTGQTKERLERAGLRFDQSKTFDSYFFRNTKLAAFLAETDPSYCLIKVPEHSMASARKDGTLSFFDPNFGEVSFRDDSKFKDFVIRFFDNERVQRNYRGSNSNTISFSVDRYNWSPRAAS